MQTGTVTLGLEWFLNPDHIPFSIASEATTTTEDWNSMSSLSVGFEIECALQ